MEKVTIRVKKEHLNYVKKISKFMKKTSKNVFFLQFLQKVQIFLPRARKNNPSFPSDICPKGSKFLEKINMIFSRKNYRKKG